MYYVITDTKIYKGRTPQDISRQLDGLVEHDQFKQVGADMLFMANDESLDFIRDTKRISSIMFGNFFKKDNSIKYMVIANFIFTLVIMFRVMG